MISRGGTVEKEVGRVTRYEALRSRAEVKLIDTLRVGDHIRVKGVRSDWRQEVEHMYVGEKPVGVARARQIVWVEVIKRAHEGDRVFVLKLRSIHSPGHPADPHLDPTDAPQPPPPAPPEKPRKPKKGEDFEIELEDLDLDFEIEEDEDEPDDEDSDDEPELPNTESFKVDIGEGDKGRGKGG